MYVVNVDLPEAGTWGAEFTTTATDAAGVETGETVRMTFSVLDAPTAIAVGQKAPASKTPTVADVGGDVTQDLDRPEARPGLLPDLGRRRPRRPQAVHARLRDAEVLHERPVRPDARPASSRSPRQTRT